MLWEGTSNTWKSVSADIQTLRSWWKKVGCASFFSCHFLVFGYLMKHSSLCLMYHIQRSQGNFIWQHMIFTHPSHKNTPYSQTVHVTLWFVSNGAFNFDNNYNNNNVYHYTVFEWLTKIKKLHLEKLYVISVCKNMQEYAKMLVYKIYNKVYRLKR